jgi:NADH-quinone oxidoreductase subunit G
MPDVNIKIDGQPVLAKPGETILKAALRAGIFIPHYCWHPGLTIAGNCRICLVHATKTMTPPGKPVIACATEVAEGMEVEASGPKVKALREGVMEFLLINHPLDCPVCDQAGECDLQQYSYDYGRETSRFQEPKTQRPRKDFGPMVRFVGNRCIVCTRCVRFTDEVTGTGELGVVNRGEMSYIDTFPGKQLDNPMSACVTDLCPVGALLDRDSMHTTRVWLLRGTKSLCGGCASGCNVNLETYDGDVKRITPRENQAVNRWWMCDEGRLQYKKAHSPTRVRSARVAGVDVSVVDALARAQEELRRAPSGSVVGLTTSHATNEELFALKQLVGKGPIGVAHAPDGGTFKAKDGFEIVADKNPNRRGVDAVLGGDQSGLAQVQQALEAGNVGLAIVHDAIPGGAPWSPELLSALGKAKVLLVIAHDDVAAAPKATVLLPALHSTEKEGTWINVKGRVQRLRAGAKSPGDLRPDLELLQELAIAAALQPRVVSAAGVFRRVAQANPAAFEGMDYNTIGDSGVQLGEGKKAKELLAAIGAGAHAGDAGGHATHATAWTGKRLPTLEGVRTGYEAGPVSRFPGRSDDEQARIPVHRDSPIGYGTRRGDL